MAGILVRVACLAVLALAAAATGAGPATAAGAPHTACTHFGGTFKASYNRRAATTGNPVRILDACCHSTGRVGVSHCFVEVTLAGTNDLGCESVDIGLDYLPSGPGKHELCLRRA